MPARKAKTARIERLRMKNYRVLRTVELKNLTQLTVLFGPNNALSEAVQ
jgi:predicted ATPase